MPVPHIFAGTAGGTTAQLDANFSFLSARADNINSLAGGGIAVGTSTPVAGRRLIVAGGAVRVDNDAQLEWGGATVGCYANGTSNTFTVFTSTTARTVTSDAAFRPFSDNALELGGSSSRWSVVRAATGAINTSDAREKTDVRAFTANELAAAKLLAAEVGMYKFLSAIALKGEPAARWHAGMTVQRVIAVMTSQSLDPFAYGFVCYDEWEADAPAGVTAGNRYSLRPDELLMFIARGLEARISALEAA